MAPVAASSPLEKLRAKIRIKNPLVVNALSEFYATALLLFIGLGIVMQFTLSGEKLNTWIQINVGWGFAIAFCVYTCCKTSGGHLNPAISFILFTFGKLPFTWFLVYSFAQLLGAFVGSALAYAVYLDQFTKFAGELRTIVGPQATAGSFCSFPAEHVSNFTAFLDQFVGTGLLALFVAVIIDKRNKIPDALHPLLFGFVIMMIGTAYGMNLGYPINPARDLGPRIFAAFIYGSEVFTYHNNYFWIPIVAPFFGVVVFGWSYHFFVGAHINDDGRVYKYVEAEMLPLKKDGEEA